MRTENQSLGIAAFSYYRRVVENQKDRILDEIIRVARKIGATAGQLADLEKAEKETQFNQAVEDIKPSRDGRRFLVNTQTGDVPPNPITVVLNWAAALKR